MIKKLIIHNENIFNLDKYEEKIRFLDINDTLKALNEKNFDVIYIKDNLTLNCLDFFGLVLAYHIRLTDKLQEKRYLPIVILSDLDEFTLIKLTDYAKIFFTKNTFLNQLPKVVSKFDNSNYYESFLNKIEIEKPKDISTNHDISNEWSIFKWAEFLRCESYAINKNKAKIEDMLYFKYLKAKYPIPKKNGLSLVPKSPLSQGNILYIDDEWEKGWADIFKKYFSESKNIKLTIPKFQYKDASYSLIEEMIREQLSNSLFDLILLDLRLTKEDHEQQNENEFSGIKLLSFIKSFNPGIQVVLLTASEKSKILNKANEYNILGYIKKESPKDDITYSKEVFKKLTVYVDNGLEKRYLKDIWSIQQNILKLEILNQERFNQIKIEIESIFEILQSDMNNKFIYSMLSIFKTIEILISFYIEERFEDKKNRFAYWIGTNQKIKTVKKDEYFSKDIKSDDKNDSTLNKIRVILYEKLDLKDKKIHDDLINLVEVRNKTIHKENPKIDENEISLWFNYLLDILTKVK